MLQNIKLVIEYDGTNFHGWQTQARGQRTVQAEIEKVLKIIFKKKITLIGSGRTDSGAHARAQVANFHAQVRLPLPTLRTALNAHLPKDITVLSVAHVPENFHARFHAKSKTYRYAIYNASLRCSIERRVGFHYPYPLNLAAMRREAKALVGRHNFKSFQAVDSSRAGKNTLRTVKSLTIKKRGDWIFVDITANGFLYKMVRNIVGTLLEVGSGRLPKGSIKRILAKRDRTAAAKTVPAQGLTLMRVRY